MKKDMIKILSLTLSLSVMVLTATLLLTNEGLAKTGEQASCNCKNSAQDINSKSAASSTSSSSQPANNAGSISGK
jgi:hypothetical protein